LDNLEQYFGFTPPTLSNIGDKIYFDENADGTRDSNKPGIEGVTMSLLDERRERHRDRNYSKTNSTTIIRTYCSSDCVSDRRPDFTSNRSSYT